MIFHSLLFARSHGEMLKSESKTLGFQYFPKDLALVNE